MTTRISDVRRFLVSGPDEPLLRFHFAVFATLNLIERRGQTLFYTCLAEDAPRAFLEAARCDVTVQEIHGAGADETYELLTMGSHELQWRRHVDEQPQTDGAA